MTRPIARHRIVPLTFAIMLLLTSFASAHPGHGAQGLRSGLAHPVTGLDHVLAMVGVGLLAVGLGRRWVWGLPAVFVLAMLAGAGLGAGGLFVPSWLAETGIALSVFVFGLLITLGAPRSATWVAALTAGFALCHGSAHAAEMPAGGSVAAFFVGFTFSTILLHAVGVGLGVMAGRQTPPVVVRTCGMAMSVCGALMLAGVL